jgi:hypothetical protein
MLKKLIILVVLMFIVIIGFIGFGSKEIFNQGGYFTKSTNGLKVNSEIDFALPDQHDKIYSLNSNTKKVIFVFSKPMSHIVKNYLANQPKEFLSSKNMLFVADISPMPVAIRNMVAMPDLKKSKYSVLLMFKPDLAKTFIDENTKDKIIIVNLENKKITNITLAINEEELIDAIR